VSVFVAILLTVAAFAFVAYPLWRRRLSPAEPAEDERLQELQSQRDTTYSMLKELEFDYQSGLLTEGDYRDLEARYKGRAVSILKGLDRVEQGSDLDDEIEREVLKLRQERRGTAVPSAEGSYQAESPGGDIDEEVEEQVTQLRRGKGRFCSQCGVAVRVDDRFCSSCGASLVGEADGS